MLEPLNKEIFKVLGDIDQIHGEIENQIMEEEEKFYRKIDLKTLILLNTT